MTKDVFSDFYKTVLEKKTHTQRPFRFFLTSVWDDSQAIAGFCISCESTQSWEPDKPETVMGLFDMVAFVGASQFCRFQDHLVRKQQRLASPVGNLAIWGIWGNLSESGPWDGLPCQISSNHHLLNSSW